MLCGHLNPSFFVEHDIFGSNIAQHLPQLLGCLLAHQQGEKQVPKLLLIELSIFVQPIKYFIVEQVREVGE